MPVKEIVAPYPLIDTDPHASRVFRYMRPSDYAYIAGGGALAPGLLYLYERADRSTNNLRPALKLTAALGLCGGIMYAYQRSTMRFWGWTENKRELELDQAELSRLASEGKPLYGETDATPYNQGVAFRNSAFSQLKFAAIPWFNLAVHPYHGTDPAKYGVKTESTEESAKAS